MRVAGIGFRAGASWQDIVALITLATKKVSLSPDDLCGLATLDRKAAEAGFIEAADHLRLRAIAIEPEVLRGMADGVRTHSPRVQALYGVGSVAEASALAAAGPGARLLLTRIATERVTCALAQGALS
jgi:cobalt-precorrin 5A hydrolase